MELGNGGEIIFLLFCFDGNEEDDLSFVLYF